MAKPLLSDKENQLRMPATVPTPGPNPRMMKK